MNHHAELNNMALRATLHCLTGCAIGEVSGMIIGTALNLSNSLTFIISIILAFIFGYSLSLRIVLKAKVPPRKAAGLVLASDTLSITTMEIMDNAVIAIIPGALSAGLNDLLFWLSLLLSLIAAFVAAFPVNRYLLKRGKGHALMH